MPGLDEFCNMLRETDSFDELEIKIVRALLTLTQRKKPKADAATIAKEAGISVTNAYKYLYSLQLKGVVESSKEKQKVFWLSRSANPFPRLFSYVGRDYLRKKELFARLAQTYERFLPISDIWSGECVREQYNADFVERAAFIIDIAREELFIATEKFFEDFVLLDAIKRALERNVHVRIVAAHIDARHLEKLERAGLEIRLGRYWPNMIISDGRHGLTIDGEGKGTMWLNSPSERVADFERAWARAQIVR
ncbi:MAG: helix-turn-helix domain-containing protein [Candidatus Aenigmatarchaeota archaeon]